MARADTMHNIGAIDECNSRFVRQLCDTNLSPPLMMDWLRQVLGLSPGFGKCLMKSFISRNTSNSFDWKTS